MRKTLTILAAIALGITTAVGSIGGLVLTNDTKSVDEVQAYTNGDASTYYSGISTSATGSTLLSALQSLNSSKLKTRVGYDNMRKNATTGNGFYLTDPGSSSSEITAFYRGSSAAITSLNNEHVWPASRTVLGRDNDPLEDDIHMVRPTLSSDNSSRGNSFYAEKDAWDPASFSNASYRGDSARIILYCVVADSQLSLVDATDDSTSNHTMGKLSDLLAWNLKYPVLTRENTRNEGAEYLQGNRNPFIDHPEYACKIWGDTNSATQSACSSSTTAPTALSVSPSSASIAIGGTTTLTATATAPSGASSSVTWSSGSTGVATVNSSTGVVTGVSAGTAVITATSTVDTSITATATITVKAISSIAISGTATTLSYTAGQKFDPTGLTVTATYTDSSTSTVANSSCVWTDTSGGTTSLVQGSTSVTCTYGGKSATYTGITVGEAAAGGTAMYTVASKSSVTTDTTNYTYPSGSSATFENTYTTANQMTSGNSQTLTLSGYNNVSISSMTLSMHSNSSKGAGKLSYSVDGGTNYTYLVGSSSSDVAFNLEAWYGSWQTSFVDVTKSSLNITGTSSNLIIKIECTTNSLYCQSYSITWGGGGSSSIPVTGITVSGNSSVAVGSTTTYTAAVTPSNATDSSVTWSVSGSNATINSSTGVVTGSSVGSATVTATANDGSGVTGTKDISITAAPAVTGDYTLVTDASTLAAGDVVVIASNASGYTAGDISSSVMSKISSTFSTDYSTITSLGTDTVEMTLGGTSSAWTFTSSSGLLGATAVKKLAWGSGTTTWTISISSSDATIQNGTSTYGRFLYNTSSPRFTTYTSDVTSTSNTLLPQLYRKSSSSSSTTAAEYAATFLSSSGVVCDNTGVTAPSTSQWSAQADAYAALSSTVQAELTNATANESGTDIQKCVARYDYILSKYGTTNYANFMNRSVSPLALSGEMSDVLSHDNATLIIVLVAVVGLTAIGGFFFINKKRKQVR